MLLAACLPASKKGLSGSGIQVVWVESPLFWALILHYSVQMEKPRALQIQELWGDVCIWDEECTPGQRVRGVLRSLGAAAAGLGCEVGQSFLQQIWVKKWF